MILHETVLGELDLDSLEIRKPKKKIVEESNSDSGKNSPEKKLEEVKKIASLNTKRLRK